MKHNIIESVLIGIIVSQWPVWQLNNIFERLLLITCSALIAYMLILAIKNEPQAATHKAQRQ